MLAKYWPVILLCLAALVLIAAAFMATTHKDINTAPPATSARQHPARKPLKASYDAATITVRRDLLVHVDTQGAAHALHDIGKGVERPNPYQRGTAEFVRYQLAYQRVFVKRDHDIADAKAAAAAQNPQAING